MFLQSLILLFLGSNLYGAGPVFPNCPRPTNLSAPGALKKFEGCQKTQLKFCDRFEKDPRCKSFLNIYNYKPKEKSVNEGCAINSAGQYRCSEKPLRFIEKEAAPQPSIPKPEEKDKDPTQTEAEGAATLAIPPPPPAKPTAPEPSK